LPRCAENLLSKIIFTAELHREVQNNSAEVSIAVSTGPEPCETNKNNIRPKNDQGWSLSPNIDQKILLELALLSYSSVSVAA